MTESTHTHIRTFSLLLICVFIGLSAWTYYRSQSQSQSLVSDLSRDLRASSYNLRTTTWNAAMLSDNLVAISGDLRDSDRGLPALLSMLNGKHGLKQVLFNIDVLTAQIGRTSNTIRVASTVEQQKIQESSDLAIGVIKKLDGLVSNTDTSINSPTGVLPALTTDLHTLDSTISSLSTNSQGLLQAGTETMQSAGRLLADPSIPAATKSLAGASEEIHGAATHLDNALGYVEDDLKPQHIPFWKALLTQALSQALGIPLKWLPTRVSVVSSVPVQTHQ